MVIFRATKKFADKLKLRFEKEPVEASSGILGDWYVNYFVTGRKQYAMCVAERSMLPLVVPASGGAAVFHKRFCAELEKLLRRIDVDENALATELEHCREYRFAATINRTIVGVQNNFISSLQRRSVASDDPDVSFILSGDYVGGPEYKRPRQEAAKLFGIEPPPRPPVQSIRQRPPAVSQAEQKVRDAIAAALRSPQTQSSEDLFESLELEHEALDMSDFAERRNLLLQAVYVDSGNTDAILALLEYCTFNPAEKIDILEQLAFRAAERLGKVYFDEDVPHFWGLHETRPYMRARYHLAIACEENGDDASAIANYRELVRLSESDGIGARYPLLNLLLAAGKLEKAAALVGENAGEVDDNVAFAWGNLLLMLLTTADDELHRSAYLRAKKQNRYIEPYIVGRQNLPKSEPEYYVPGTREEAAAFAKPIVKAWQKHPSAIDVLKSFRNK